MRVNSLPNKTELRYWDFSKLEKAIQQTRTLDPQKILDEVVLAAVKNYVGSSLH